MKKYALRELNFGSYVNVPGPFYVNPVYGFNYTNVLAEATLFDDIATAIETVVIRQLHSSSQVTKVFTIVGVEEVISTVRKEVAL